MSHAGGPLAGIRVLDLTRLLPGPMCSLHLADMGADVIKVEDLGAGDYARLTRGYFELINRNKRSFAIDLKQASGKALFRELVATADVLIEGFRPGVVERLGIDYESLRVTNPALVYCAITGYGQTGPYRGRAGHDLNYCALAGITDQIGNAGGAPAIPNLQIADLLGGALSAATGILAALVAAQRSGSGSYVDVAMADCALAHSVFALMALNEYGDTRPRGEDFLSGALPWYAVYETADRRFVALGALEGKFWCAFCEAIDRPEWSAQDADAHTRQQIRRELESMFKTRARDEWIARFAAVDCCLTPVLTLKETAVHEQFAAREMFVEHNGRLQFALPFKLNDHVFSVTRYAPAQGQHTRELLDELGVTAAQQSGLAGAGVVLCPVK